MRKIIINADGFGFTKGINQAIFEVAKVGSISSVSCNVNFPYIEDITDFSKAFSNISIGLHLNINVGKPILNPKEIPSLVDENGEFWNQKFTRRYLLGKIKFKDIYKELCAQVEKLLSYNVNISHLDGHQNKHLYPGYFGKVLKIGKKYNIQKIRCHRRYLFIYPNKQRFSKLAKYYLLNPKRILSHLFARYQMLYARMKGFKMADRLITPAYLGNSYKYQEKTWIDIIQSCPIGVNEIYCHPGYPDDELRKYAKYVDERLIETEILKSDVIKNCLLKENVDLISFNELN